MGKLLALFVLVPLIELALLIQLGRLVGLWPTLGLIVGTGFLGAWLTRRQGLDALRRMQEELRQQRVPAGPLLDGILILLAGAVLLTPGLLTDVAGFLLLVPACRRLFRDRVRRRFARAVEEGRVQVRWNLDVHGERDAEMREPEWEERDGPRGESRRGTDELL